MTTSSMHLASGAKSGRIVEAVDDKERWRRAWAAGDDSHDGTWRFCLGRGDIAAANPTARAPRRLMDSVDSHAARAVPDCYHLANCAACRAGDGGRRRVCVPCWPVRSERSSSQADGASFSGFNTHQRRWPKCYPEREPVAGFGGLGYAARQTRFHTDSSVSERYIGAAWARPNDVRECGA